MRHSVCVCVCVISDVLALMEKKKVLFIANHNLPHWPALRSFHKLLMQRPTSYRWPWPVHLVLIYRMWTLFSCRAEESQTQRSWKVIFYQRFSNFFSCSEVYCGAPSPAWPPTSMHSQQFSSTVFDCKHCRLLRTYILLNKITTVQNIKIDLTLFPFPLNYLNGSLGAPQPTLRTTAPHWPTLEPHFWDTSQ